MKTTGSKLRAAKAKKDRQKQDKECLADLGKHEFLIAIEIERVIYLKPSLTIGLLFQLPHGLDELTDQEKKTHEGLRDKAWSFYTCLALPVINIQCTPEEAGVISKLLRYLACRIAPGETHKVLSQAKSIRIDKITIAKEEDYEKELQKICDDMAEDYVKLSEYFGRVAREVNSDGIAICFHKKDLAEAKRKYYQEKEEGSEFLRYIFSMDEFTLDRLLEESGHSKSLRKKAAQEHKKQRRLYAIRSQKGGDD